MDYSDINDIPLFIDSIKSPSIITATEKVKNRLHLANIPELVLPERLIISFFKKLNKKVEEQFNPEVYKYHDDFSIYKFNTNKIEYAYLYPTMGSYASNILEEMIALGAKKILFIGGVGTTSQMIHRGDLIVPIRAIRDEGVSYHYQEPGIFSHPSEVLLKKIFEVLKNNDLNYFEGTSWTTSSVYREAEEKLKRFSKYYTLCVEMEAASFFSIGNYRNIDIAGLFIAGDSIANNKWDSLKTRDTISSIEVSREKLLDLAIKILD